MLQEYSDRMEHQVKVRQKKHAQTSRVLGGVFEKQGGVV